jgi:hypothetical protein
MQGFILLMGETEPHNYPEYDSVDNCQACLVHVGYSLVLEQPYGYNDQDEQKREYEQIGRVDNVIVGLAQVLAEFDLLALLNIVRCHTCDLVYDKIASSLILCSFSLVYVKSGYLIT